MLSQYYIEIFTGRENRILAGKHKKYQNYFLCRKKGEIKQRRKSRGVEGGWKKGDRKAGEYGLRNWCKKKKKKVKQGARVRPGQRADFTQEVVLLPIYLLVARFIGLSLMWQGLTHFPHKSSWLLMEAANSMHKVLGCPMGQLGPNEWKEYVSY